MNSLESVAPAFVEMANSMVYGTLTTVDRKGRPRARIVHSLWQWKNGQLVGWVGSMVTPVKQAHLRNNPWVSCNHWDGAERYDTCVAECKAELLVDDESCAAGWELFESTPPPLGYDPASVMPEWQDPTSPAWGVLRMVPWRVKVFPGVFARTAGAEGEILTWQDDSV